MFRFISNIPIFRRLSIIFAITALIPGIVIASLGVFYIDSIGKRGEAVKTSFEAQEVATSMQVSLQRMNGLLEARFYQIYAEGNKDLGADPSLFASGALNASEISSIELDFAQNLSNYQTKYELVNSDALGNQMGLVRQILRSDAQDQGTGIINPQHQALSDVVHTFWPNYQNEQSQVLTDLNTSVRNSLQDYRLAYTHFYAAEREFLNLRNSWQQVLDNTKLMGTTVTTVGPSLLYPLYGFTIGAFLFIIVLIAFTGYIVNSTISRPLSQLAALTKRIAGGDTGERALIRGRDEIAVVASSLNNMLEYIVRLAQEAQSRHTALQTQIEKLVNEVSGVGEGDLRIQAEVTTDELGVLADSFNFMTEELSSLVVRVKMLSREVEKSTMLAFDRMVQLVQGADVQIQQIVTAAVEVGDMATASRNAVERAQVLSEVANQASNIAQGGRNAVHQTVQGIGRINTNVRATSEKVLLLGDRSREIGNIVKVISSIAHQTNRLALDAAIQAAMAGDNGKGFGAVASDIRRLAENAKEQTFTIGKIVNTVLEDIDAAAQAMTETERETNTGTHLVEEAGQALESIFSVVESQAEEIAKINQVAMQQLQSSNAVVQIMQSVSDSTQYSSTSTREASLQMEHIARLAEQLQTSVDVFKLRDDRAQYLSTPNAMAGFGQYDQVSSPHRAVSPPAQSQQFASAFPMVSNNPTDPFAFYSTNSYPYPISQPGNAQPGSPEYAQQQNRNRQQQNGNQQQQNGKNPNW